VTGDVIKLESRRRVAVMTVFLGYERGCLQNDDRLCDYDLAAPSLADDLLASSRCIALTA
jgi:hypothetical protein